MGRIFQSSIVYSSVKGTSKYHHSVFTSTPGIVFAKVSSTAEEECIVSFEPKLIFFFFLK